jgi:hypothetical protein
LRASKDEGPSPFETHLRRAPQGDGASLAAAQSAAHITTLAFGRTAAWSDDDNALRRRFWRKLRAGFTHLPFAEDLLAAYYCAFDRSTPLAVKASLAGALAP